jgi:predicted acylesterase/phospholipase RssA
VAVVLEQGIRPDVFIGVSAGAWNGAYLAADPTPERARQLCAIWAGLKTADLLGGGWWQAAISAVSGQTALYRAAGPIRVARRYLDRQTFEALQTPLSILATNLTNGQPQILTSGRLLPAMLASSAVPGIFPPITIDGQLYVDGGLLEWEAAASALRQRVQTVYLFGCGALGALAPLCSLPQEALEQGNGQRSGGGQQITAWPSGPPGGSGPRPPMLEVLERCWEVVSRYQFHKAAEGLRAAGVEVISFEPLLPAPAHLLDFSRGQLLVDAGRASAEAVLREQGQPLLPGRSKSSTRLEDERREV